MGGFPRPPANEPLLDYRTAGDSRHRVELEQCIKELRATTHEIPIVIDGKRYQGSGVWRHQLIPFEHSSGKPLAKFRYANSTLIGEAIRVSETARRHWDAHWSLESRASLFERAAHLASTKYRQRLNAATMLGQAKTIEQAEMDAAGELIDFLRFNAFYATKVLWPMSQPNSPQPTKVKNSVQFRSLDGFVAAISPFNFTAIGANLASAPCLMGNSVIWKPSDSSMLANWITFQLFEEAGFPPGLINFVPADGFEFGRMITGNPFLAGINFTGSLDTFRWLWSEVGLNIRRYTSFPRLMGECGGKNFHFVHPSADPEVVLAQTIRSAFEYSGQKCSACSRLYVPASLWLGESKLKDQFIDITTNKLVLGPATDLDTTFLSAVIDARALAKCQSYLAQAYADPDQYSVLAGGNCPRPEQGYFVEPTIIECKHPGCRLMREEIFGPLLSVYVYPDNETNITLDLIDECPYALTGAIFARDEKFLTEASQRLRMAAGNLYINDKSSGAIVGQQPFGGARLSGTNDKAGGPHNLMRWCNQRTIKQVMESSTVWSNTKS